MIKKCIDKKVHKIWKAIQKINNFSWKGKFFNRSRENEKLCIILAGYKEYLYPVVFERLEKYLEDDIDVCIVSSGLYSEKLSKIAQQNNWSYLATKQNNVCLVQNVAIELHPKAKYIFKLDEDIFITKDYFKNMLRSYNHAMKGLYIPGVLAPMIPINGFSHLLILQKLNMLEIYKEKFEEPKYAAGFLRKIENDPNVATFMWGMDKDSMIPTIDEMNEIFSKQTINEIPCPIRFSIGAILFERELWDRMGNFKVKRRGNSMGRDEVQICSYCCTTSNAFMVTENVVVGHLSFTGQNRVMQEVFINNIDKFRS